MPVQGSLSIERMCLLAGVSRAGFYRSLQEQMPVEEDMEVRSAIQQIAVEHRRRYGYRRIAAELRPRHPSSASKKEQPRFEGRQSEAYDCPMKIDNRDDALNAAHSLLNANADRIADALLEAYLEGIEQARSQFHQGLSYQQIAKDLKARSEFISSQISK